MEVLLSADVAERVSDLAREWRVDVNFVVDRILRKSLIDGQQGIQDEDLTGGVE